MVCIILLGAQGEIKNKPFEVVLPCDRYISPCRHKAVQTYLQQ